MAPSRLQVAGGRAAAGPRPLSGLPVQSGPLEFARGRGSQAGKPPPGGLASAQGARDWDSPVAFPPHGPAGGWRSPPGTGRGLAGHPVSGARPDRETYASFSLGPALGMPGDTGPQAAFRLGVSGTLTGSCPMATSLEALNWRAAVQALDVPARAPAGL